ncbi:unnamed protein product [Citrullus colocynthis]|uniref:Uncharacterized protein n=1 Tax=Citrullus colocynthis TaxID=252529 RepID=A0ABP0Y3N7_9ROSI
MEAINVNTKTCVLTRQETILANVLRTIKEMADMEEKAALQTPCLQFISSSKHSRVFVARVVAEKQGVNLVASASKSCNIIISIP